jgi:hypothetical protein
MAWFRNHYTCARCDYEWEDEDNVQNLSHFQD